MEILSVNNKIKNSVTYIIFSYNSADCLLIDCGEWDTLKPVLERLCKRVKTVFLTHGHSDHIYGLLGLIEEQPWVEIATNEDGHIEIGNKKKNLSLYNGYQFEVIGYHKLLINGGEVLHFNNIGDIEVIATPGHDTSCMSYKIGKHIFTGDSYLPGIQTYTKFPGGNKEQAAISYSLLKQIESQGYIVHCGHHSY